MRSLMNQQFKKKTLQHSDTKIQYKFGSSYKNLLRRVNPKMTIKANGDHLALACRWQCGGSRHCCDPGFMVQFSFSPEKESDSGGVGTTFWIFSHKFHISKYNINDLDLNIN